MGLEMFWYVDCVSVMLQETETELDSLCKVVFFVFEFGILSHETSIITSLSPIFCSYSCEKNNFSA